MTRKNGNTEGKTEYGLLVTIDTRDTYAQYNVKAQVVILKTDREVEYLSSYDNRYDLALRSQQSREYPETYTPEPYYNTCERVTLERATEYVKVLTKINKSLDKERATRGSAQDYAEHVVRFALALGIKTIVEKTPNSAEGYAYRFHSLGDGASWLRWEEAKWAELYGKKKVEQTA